MSLRLDYFYTSHIGNVRSSNQDNLFCVGEYMDCINKGTDNIISGTILPLSKPLFAVFDGMGGEEQGEIAAYIAAEQMSKFKFQNDPHKSLLDYCMIANSEICNFAQENNIHSMGTTAAILMFDKKKAYVCNIGDSKIFSVSNGTLKQISVDHVCVSAFGKKPPLSQNLGIPENELIISPYTATFKYKPGDIFLICSDGLTDMMTPMEIENILLNTDKGTATEILLKTALKNGGKDNVTLILIYAVKEKVNGLIFNKNIKIKKH